MHCFKFREARSPGGWNSLCGDWLLPRSGGPKCGRPPVVLRCPACSVAEAKMLGKEQLPAESDDWRDVGVLYAERTPNQAS
jgi:hypothetical protein